MKYVSDGDILWTGEALEVPPNRDSRELMDSSLDDEGGGGGGGGSMYSDMRPPKESGLEDTLLSTERGSIEFCLRGGKDGSTGGRRGGKP